MIALLRKDRDGLLVSLAVGTLLAFLVFSAIGFQSLFVLPSNWTLRPLVELGWMPAAILGILVALREDLGRTREFLLHRPIGRGQAFWSRTLAGAAVIVLWTVLGVVLLVLSEIAFGRGLSCADWSRSARSFSSLGAHALACYGLALFAFRLPVSWRTRVVVGGAGWFLVQAVHVWLGAAPPDGEPFGRDHVFALLALFVLFSAAAAAGEREGKDLDLPVSTRTLARIGPMSLLALFVAGTVAASQWQGNWRGRLAQVRPMVVEVVRGELALAGPLQPDDTRALLGPDHLPTGKTWMEESGSRIADLPPDRPTRRVGWFEARFLRSDTRRTSFRVGRVWRNVELLSSGSMRVVDVDGAAGARRCWRVVRTEGGAFSPRAQVFDDNENSTAFVLEPEEGTLWRVTDHLLPRLVACPFPEAVRYRAAGGDIVLGERGAWTWEANDWKPASAEALERERWAIDPITDEWVRLGSGRPALLVEVVDPDPLAPEVIVRLPEGGAELRHRFAPRTGRERLCAALALAGALARPAPSALWSAMSGPSEPSRELVWLHDPLLREGRRERLAANLLLHTALGALAALVLRRRGAPVGRALGWSVAVFCSGLLGLLVLRWVETRRAWARPVVSVAREPLIRSA